MHGKSTLKPEMVTAHIADSGLNSSQPSAAETSVFGLPRFDWSLTLIGLYVFTFVIVTYKVNIAGVGIVIGLIGLFFGSDRVRLPFPVWFFAAFLFWAFLSSFASPYPDIAQERLIDGLKLLLILIVAINALRTQGQLRFYLIFLVGCFILFPVRGALVNYYIAGYNVFGRAIWNYIYANPNDLAALCLLALGLALAIRMSTPSRNLVRLGAVIAIALLLWVILLTQSRGAFLGLSVLMSLLFIHSLKKSLRTAIALAVLVLVVAVYVPDSVWDRLSGIRMLASTSTLHEADWEGSAAQRFEIQKVAWNIFTDHKLFGVGFGAYHSAHESYAPEMGARSAHNTYLALAAEVGLPGVMLWCALVGSVLLYAYRRQRRVENKELADQQRWIWWGFVAFLVAGFFASYAALTFPYLMLAVLWSSGNLLSSLEMPEENNARQLRNS